MSHHPKQPCLNKVYIIKIMMKLSTQMIKVEKIWKKISNYYFLN